MEGFSPPRILEHTATLGLRGDLSADLATGWDLSLEWGRANLLTEIVRRRPKIVFLEPPCTWFSKLLSYNWKHIPRHLREQRLAASMVLFEFSLLIMRIQLLAGRTFVLEHPHGATSWKHPQVQDALRRFPGTDFADFDFCMFGMVSKINHVPVKKPTRLMTNCKHIYSRFAGVRCDGSHDHIMCCDSDGGRSGPNMRSTTPTASALALQSAARTSAGTSPAELGEGRLSCDLTWFSDHWGDAGRLSCDLTWISDHWILREASSRVRPL